MEIDFFKEDWHEDLGVVDLVLAADVVYNPEITRAFFNTLEHLINQNRPIMILIAMEKRLWTDALGVITAPSYSYFMQCLTELPKTHPEVEISQNDLGFSHILSQLYQRVENLVL